MFKYWIYQIVGPSCRVQLLTTFGGQVFGHYTEVYFVRGVLYTSCCFAHYSWYLTIVDLFVPTVCPHRSSGVGAHVIHPWIHQFSNCWSRDDQLTSVRVPDVDPCDLPILGLFSMAAGDFLTVYTIAGLYMYQGYAQNVQGDRNTQNCWFFFMTSSKL